MPKFFRVLAVGLLLCASIFIVELNQPPTCREQYRLDSQVQFANYKEPLRVEVASDSTAQEKGLSGRKCIQEGVGMLFSFEQSRVQGIWMKDMNFAIDIIWMNEDRKVTAIEEAVQPSSYPHIFDGNHIAAKYVLELGAGGAKAVNIRTGDAAQF